jgi:parvulin-like peptidyl-prolyl isomerase
LAKKKRRDRVPTPTWEQPEHEGLAGSLRGRSPTFYMTSGVVLLVVVALVIVGYALISDYIADQRRPGSVAVRVDDKEFDLRYYSERLKTYVQQSGGVGSAAAQPEVAMPAVTSQLVEETVVLRFAGELGISATEDEVNAEIATRLGTEADSADFETRLQDELDRTGVSEDDYRDQMEAAVLQRKLNDHFLAELPETAESVHYRQILVETREEADQIRSDIEGGADAAEIAKEKSLDTQTSEEGGDVGWVPRRVLATDIEETLFSMEPNDVRVVEVSGRFFVFQLIEKDDAREIEEDQKPSLAARDVGEWTAEKQASIEVQEYVSTDNDKAAWVIKRAYDL